MHYGFVCVCVCVCLCVFASMAALFLFFCFSFDLACFVLRPKTRKRGAVLHCFARTHETSPFGIAARVCVCVCEMR